VEKGQKREERKRVQGEKKGKGFVFVFSFVLFYKPVFFAN
jgi:hypothetical protein